MADNKSIVDHIKEFLREYVPWTAADRFLYSSSLGLFLSGIAHRWVADASLRHDAGVVFVCFALMTILAALFVSGSRTRIQILVAALVLGVAAYDWYDRYYPTRILGQLSDSSKWELAQSFKKLGPYPLLIVYYPSHQDAGEEIAQAAKCGGWTDTRTESTETNKLEKGIVVKGRASNPHVDDLANLLSDTYGVPVTKDGEDWKGDSLVIDIGN